MSRLTSGGRMERLLSIVPWVVANDGPTIAEISERFDYPEAKLLDDLNNVLFMVGTYPFTPDQLVEVIVEDGRVWIRYAEYFERPLRLTPEQGLALVTAGSSLLAVPGADPDGPLARGLDKLAATLGVTPGSDIEIDLGQASAETLATIREAIAQRRQIDIEYYAYNRDEVTTRRIDPYRVTSDQGQWYLLAHCHRAEGERGSLRDLSVSETVVDREEKHLALLLRQRCDLLQDARRLVVGVGGRGQLRHGHRRVGAESIHPRFPRSLAKPIDQASARDRRNERRLRSGLRVEAAGAAPEFDEDLLHGVFRLRRGSQEPSRQRPHQAAVAIETLPHGEFVSGCNSR